MKLGFGVFPDVRISIPSSVLNGNQKHASPNGLMTIILIDLWSTYCVDRVFFRCELPLIGRSQIAFYSRALLIALTATTPMNVLSSLNIHGVQIKWSRRLQCPSLTMCQLFWLELAALHSRNNLPSVELAESALSWVSYGLIWQDPVVNLVLPVSDLDIHSICAGCSRCLSIWLSRCHRSRLDPQLH